MFSNNTQKPFRHFNISTFRHLPLPRIQYKYTHTYNYKATTETQRKHQSHIQRKLPYISETKRIFFSCPVSLGSTKHQPSLSFLWLLLLLVVVVVLLLLLLPAVAFILFSPSLENVKDSNNIFDTKRSIHLPNNQKNKAGKERTQHRSLGTRY